MPAQTEGWRHFSRREQTASLTCQSIRISTTAECPQPDAAAQPFLPIYPHPHLLLHQSYFLSSFKSCLAITSPKNNFQVSPAKFWSPHSLQYPFSSRITVPDEASSVCPRCCLPLEGGEIRWIFPISAFLSFLHSQFPRYEAGHSGHSNSGL